MKWFFILLFTVQILSQERAYRFEQYEAKLELGDTLIFTNVRKNYYLILALLLSASSHAQIMISDKGYNPPADVFPPSVVTGLNGVAISDDSLLFYWNHSPENDLNRYVAWFMGAVKDSTSNDSIYIGGLTPNTTYGLRVLSVDNNGNRSAYSDSVQKTTYDTTSSSATPPEMPTNLTVSDSTDDITLTWTNNPPNATNIVIMKNSADYDTVAYPLATWTESDTTDGVYSTYKLYAYNAGGESDTTSTVTTARHSSNTIYVKNPGGSNSGLGTVELPYLTIGKVNSLWLGGKTVKFNGTFTDASLICQPGVTYTSYGGNRAVVGDSTSTLTTNPTVIIDVENVVLNDLKIYGFKNALKVITYSLGDLTINNCEIVGGQNAHANDWTYGIYQTNHDPTGADDVTITYNKFHGIGFACIYWAFPYNWNVSYNEFYDLWMDNGKADWGGLVIANATTITESGEWWDCDYTVNVHHNIIHDFEYGTISIPSRGIAEYNEIYGNLDERLYFGGVKHGDVGKLWDGYTMGQVFRYNYVHDLYIRGQAGYTYDTPTDEQRAAGTPNVVTTSNGTDHPIYLNAGSGGYGTNFGDATGENPENLLGGQGYGNFWIHNNIFYNCTKGITDRGTNYYPGTSTQLPYDSTKACYLLNNTIINCGIWTYGAPYSSLVFSHAAAQSPQKSMNNIYHYGDVDAASAIYYWEKDSYSHNDIFISPLTGTHYGVPDLGDNFAITGNYSADDISISGQQYNLAQSEIWNDTSATVLCSTIGFGSTYIPDVRIIVDSEADNTGKAWSLLGDNYTVSSVLVEWTDTHTLGQDPTGRSFAYDIFGTQRTRNIIGAVKRVGD